MLSVVSGVVSASLRSIPSHCHPDDMLFSHLSVGQAVYSQSVYHLMPDAGFCCVSFICLGSGSLYDGLFALGFWRTIKDHVGGSLQFVVFALAAG